MLAFSLLLSALALSSTAVASPAPLSLRTRQSIACLTYDQREELAKTIAVDLFGNTHVPAASEVDLNDRLAAWLQNEEWIGEGVCGQNGERLSQRKRLFGLGGSSDSDDNSGYAPRRVDCPAGQTFVRASNNLSDTEINHVNARLNSSRFDYYLSSINLTASDLNLSLNDSTISQPKIGLAFSGGGYRAMISGGGGLWAMDPRNEEARAAGTANIGALASYITGLSGGSWLVSTYLANQNTSVPDLVANHWNLSSNLIIPDDGIIDNVAYFTDMLREVSAKRDMGYQTQITDYWGLALGDHLFPAEYGVRQTPNLSMSDISNLSPNDYPYPIIVAAEREPGEISVAANATVWEFSYDSLGTWGFGGGVGGAQANIVGAFTSMKYLGTDLNGGQPTGQCIENFDNLGFVIGTSATLFNGAYAMLNATNSDGLVQSAISAILGEISSQENDVAVYPNPFYGFANDTNPTAQWEELTLVDAGLTNQNLPLEPLLIPLRGVDAILAFDSSADTTYSWPNGSALWTTYTRFRSLSEQLNVEPFMPEIPTTNTFVNLGLNTRPTFFGCSNSSEVNTTVPLIIYVPNYAWSSFGNQSTYKLDYSDEEAYRTVYNGMRGLTLNNTIDNWSTCLACALADRAVGRNGGQRAQVCRDCFADWCWNGENDDSTPSSDYAPVPGTLPTLLSNLGATASPVAPPSNAAEPSSSAQPSGAASTRQGSASATFTAAAMLIGIVFGASLQMF